MGMNISLIWMQNVSSHKLSKMYIVKYYNKYELNDEYLKKKMDVICLKDRPDGFYRNPENTCTCRHFLHCPQLGW